MPFMLTIIKTFDVVDVGVIDALSPVTSALAPDATLADHIVVSVVD